MDAVSHFSAQWAAERPGLDVDAIAVWGRLKRATSIFDTTLSRALKLHGLRLGEFEILAALVRSGTPYEMRPTELTHTLIVTPGAVTARLTALEGRGLIVRRKDRNDGRVQLVILSAAGLKAFQPAFDAVVAESERLVNSLEPLERTAFQDSLSEFLARIDVFDIDADVEG